MLIVLASTSVVDSQPFNRLSIKAGVASVRSAIEAGGQQDLVRNDSALDTLPCSIDLDGTTPSPVTDFENSPVGITTSVRAVGVANLLPELPVRLQSTRVQLGPKASSNTLLAPGPVLFFVEDGSVTVYVEGSPVPLQLGESRLIQMDGLYALHNPSAETATVLRLALVPLESPDVPIANFRTPEVNDAPPPGPPPNVELLFRSEVDALPAGDARLFIACVGWTQAGADDVEHSHPGPVGLLVQDGTLIVDSTTRLQADDCWMLQPDIPYRAHAESAVAEAVMFGVIPDGEALWVPADPASASELSSSAAVLDLECGQP